MATIEITFNTTSRQDARLARILEDENAQRVARGLSPYQDVADMFRGHIIDWAKATVTNYEAKRAENIQQPFVRADEAVQDQVLALLDPWV